MANGIVAVARAALSYAELIGWRAANTNPAFRLRLRTLPPRVVVWTPAEVAHLVDTADRMGLASVGDAVVIALHSGQRQGDVLALAGATEHGAAVVLRQSKTGALVRVPATDQLTARLAVMRQRRRAGSVVALSAPAELVIMEATGRRYASDTFRHTFARVRKAAAETMPSVAGKWFSDLRDTAVTRLALAACSIPEICAITGHSLEGAHAVLKHYLALSDDSARAGIEKLQIYLAKERIVI